MARSWRDIPEDIRKMKDSFSPEQRDIIFGDGRRGDPDILVVKAYAGSGKSFTLKNFVKCRPHKRFVYFVYNKSMKLDALRSFSGIDNVEIRTFHGLAFQNVGVRFKERIEQYGELKPFDLIQFFPEKIRKRIGEENLPIYAKGLLSLVVEFCSSDKSLDDFIYDLHSRGSVEWERVHMVRLAFILPLLKDLWNTLVTRDDLPFLHDIYLKLYHLERPKIEADYILVDEAQDINPVMYGIVLQQTHTKKIFVGDSFQSIYSWRGAVDSLEYLERNHGATVKYLSISFRCPPDVGELANLVIRKAGATKTFIGKAKPKTGNIKQKTYIARTNSGLLGFCAKNIDKRIFYVGGFDSYNFKDILDIKKLAMKKHEYIYNDFIKNFSDIKELMEYAEATGDVSLNSMIGIVMKFNKIDLFSLVKTLKERSVSPSKASQADIVVTTAHKSKGLEWPNVVLIDDFPFYETGEVKEGANTKEELRLLYVAITRAQGSIKIPERILSYLGERRMKFLSTEDTGGKVDFDALASMLS